MYNLEAWHGPSPVLIVHCPYTHTTGRHVVYNNRLNEPTFFLPIDLLISFDNNTPKYLSNRP